MENKNNNTRYVFVTGGSLSGLGKGILASSIGMLLKEHGYVVSMAKYDPYLNIDPGTQNPIEHGECYVTDDGSETDLDLGHYYRFTGCDLTKNSSISSGKLYNEILTGERNGTYLGKTVQIVPHLTDLIQVKFQSHTESDIHVIEIGGTIEDIESQPYLEAARQFAKKVGRSNVIYAHLTYVPYIKATKELKTKLTQQTVKNLRSIGINPDILLCRTELPLPKEMKQKISVMCDVDKEAVFEGLDVDTVYDVPISLFDQGLDRYICKKLKIYHDSTVDLKNWKQVVKQMKEPKGEVNIAIVGKYIELEDAYKSVVESLKHAGAKWQSKINITWVDSERIEKWVEHQNIALEKNWAFDSRTFDQVFLKDVHGILVPGGFGLRGLEGKILAIEWARENNVPCFGICLGMQMMSVEFARNKLNIKDAISMEADADGSSLNHIIHLMESQKEVTKKGGTMRLGSYACKLRPDSKSFKNCYNEQLVVDERHRHRYEFNNKYREEFEANGMMIAGTSPDGNLVEIVEYSKNKFHIGCQFHPEFKSKLTNPHPLFLGFVLACINSWIDDFDL